MEYRIGHKSFFLAMTVFISFAMQFLSEIAREQHYIHTFCSHRLPKKWFWLLNYDVTFTLLYVLHTSACILTCLSLNEYWLIDWLIDWLTHISEKCWLICALNPPVDCVELLQYTAAAAVQNRPTDCWNVLVCSGRYCEHKLEQASSLSTGIVVLIVVVILLVVLVVVLLILVLRARNLRKFAGSYRPSSVEQKAGSLPLPTVASSSTSTTPLHLVVGHTKREVLVWTVIYVRSARQQPCKT